MMGEWTKQTEEFVRTWAETQKKLWGGWVELAEQQTGRAPLAETWRKTVDAWEAAVKSGLQAQLDLARTVSDNVAAVKDVSRDVREWSEQTEQLGARWNAAQKQLWESYFQMVRKAVPGTLVGRLDEENQKLFRVWQESVDKIAAAHSAWARTWTEQASRGASEPQSPRAAS